MYQGDKNRNTAFTSMNSHSSRSHAVYMIKVEKRVKYNIEQLEELEKKGEKPDQSMTKSVLYLVDLAGSERVSKSKAAGSRLDEAKNINLGLLALGNCIQALSDKKAKYVPFRDSKLTRLLEDSLGGNSKTSLVVTIGPSLGHYQESISSLLFGTRAMKVENRPELNITIDYKALCAQLQAELDKINDSTSWWTIEKQQLNEKLNKANTDIENLNNDKVEMQLTIDELKLKSKEINQPAYLKISDEEIAKLKAYYKEKMKKKEQEYKKNIDEYDAQNNDLIKENTTLKKHVIDLENKNNQAKHEIKRYRDELEHEKKDRQIRINQMNSDIEDLQRALAAEKEKKEKEIIAQTYENKPDCVTMYEEILKSNEEKFRNTVEEYEQDINILRDNLTKLSLERDELAGEKYKLLQKLGVLTKKASHIAKESVRIRSETENHNQEVKILKDKNETLQKKFDDVSGKLNESEKVKEDLANNNKVLSKIHQEFINNEKIKTAQLKYITEEVYMTMKNLERMSIRFQEKMLYFITQKAQTVASAHVDASKVVESYKGIIQNMREELVKAKGK
jgi:chromosome segregation ATPase